MQSRTGSGLQLFSSMPKMPQKKQRVQSASARKEAKLRVWNLTLFHTPISHQIFQGYKGYKDGQQPETLADGNWLVKQNQPVSKIETKSDTNLRSLYES